MIIVPPYLNLIYGRSKPIRGNEKPIIASAGSLKGEIRMVLMDLNHNVKLDTGYQPNLITDAGLINLTNYASYASHCWIGTGVTAPTYTDTQLANMIAYYDTTRSGYPYTEGGAPDYEIVHGLAWRFNAGNGVGTITEACTGPGNTSHTNNNITSRALISPGVSKSVDQVLDVFWRYTYYPPLSVITTLGVDIPEDGGGSILYDVSSLSVGIHASSAGSTIFRQQGVWTGNTIRAYDDYLTSHDPTSNAVQGGTDDNYPHYWGQDYGTAALTGPHSAYRDVTVSATLDAGNTGHPTPPGNGIRTMVMAWDNYTYYAHEYVGQADPNRLIPKDNTRICEFLYRNTWSRIP